MSSIRQFELMIEIERLGSISKAAESLSISQPTLSKYLANIENQLGLELFDRTTIPIRLTPAGEKYINAGRKILDVHHQLDKELESLKHKKTTEVKVGISPSRAPYILPEVIKKFREINKRTKVIVFERTINQLNNELMRGALDIIISLLKDETMQFERVELFNENIYLAVPKSMSEFSPVEILKSTPIISTGSYLSMGKILSNILSELSASEPMIEVQSIESALSLVESGLGSMLVPSYIADYKRYSDVIYMDLPDDVKKEMKNELDRKVCVFYKKEQFLSSAEKDFIKSCR